jgi:hypothetical protein
LSEEKNQQQEEKKSETEKKAEPEQEQGEEKSQLDKFVSGSLRGPKRGIYQQLLALLLVKANRSNDPFIKIQSICEAALMSKNKKKLDMDLIDQIYKVAQSFAASEVRELRYSHVHRYTVGVVKINWTFPQTEENCRKYIMPWHYTSVSFYAHKTNWRRRKYPLEDRMTTVSPWDWNDYYNKWATYIEKLQDKIEEELDQLPDWQRFFEMASALTKNAFKTLKGEFNNWAIKQLLEIQTILSEEVDPEIYKETYSMSLREEREENK